MELKEKVLGLATEKADADGGIRIYTSSWDEGRLDPGTIKELTEAGDPMEAFMDMLSERACDYGAEYGEEGLMDVIRLELDPEERELFDENRAELLELVRERIYFYYDPEDFNNEVAVDVMVNSGNWNYDCTCDCMLGYYGGDGMDERSSMLWLAKQQGKEKEFTQALTKWQHGDFEGKYGRFTESCLTELENFTSSMGTVTFLAEMKLFDLLGIIKLFNEEEGGKIPYEPEKSTGRSYMVLGKGTMCGIYDPWSGGGSLLGIELEKDVIIPIRNAVITPDEPIRYGRWSVRETYGMCKSAWKDTLKSVRKAIPTGNPGEYLTRGTLHGSEEDPRTEIL